ncbi:hypothetical protein [Campylobacter jejuni]|uniref:hypothetical protein n=1 Tax=Campylobacter jejuni TaxID=197 RepID=UPI001873EE85|nr:hypothetical protein [Campylobacter jejuni]HDZ4294167.1 hypothetical protein [Campylobacter jejuni]
MILETEVVSNNNIVLFENEELGQNAILREFELPRLNLYSFDTGFGIKEFTMIDEPMMQYLIIF